MAVPSPAVDKVTCDRCGEEEKISENGWSAFCQSEGCADAPLILAPMPKEKRVVQLPCKHYACSDESTLVDFCASHGQGYVVGTSVVETRNGQSIFASLPAENFMRMQRNEIDTIKTQLAEATKKLEDSAFQLRQAEEARMRQFKVFDAATLDFQKTISEMAKSHEHLRTKAQQTQADYAIEATVKEVQFQEEKTRLKRALNTVREEFEGKLVDEKRKVTQLALDKWALTEEKRSLQTEIEELKNALKKKNEEIENSNVQRDVVTERLRTVKAELQEKNEETPPKDRRIPAKSVPSKRAAARTPLKEVDTNSDDECQLIGETRGTEGTVKSGAAKRPNPQQKRKAKETDKEKVTSGRVDKASTAGIKSKKAKSVRCRRT